MFAFHIFAVPAAVSAWAAAVMREVAALPFDGIFIDGYRFPSQWTHQLIPDANASEQVAWLDGAWNRTGAARSDAMPGIWRLPNGRPLGAGLTPGYNAVSIEFFDATTSSIID